VLILSNSRFTYDTQTLLVSTWSKCVPIHQKMVNVIVNLKIFVMHTLVVPKLPFNIDILKVLFLKAHFSVREDRLVGFSDSDHSEVHLVGIVFGLMELDMHLVKLDFDHVDLGEHDLAGEFSY
jgi:hypothetical protein